MHASRHGRARGKQRQGCGNVARAHLRAGRARARQDTKNERPADCRRRRAHAQARHFRGLLRSWAVPAAVLRRCASPASNVATHSTATTYSTTCSNGPNTRSVTAICNSNTYTGWSIGTPWHRSRSERKLHSCIELLQEVQTRCV